MLVGMQRETVFIGFGSNLGDRFDFCDRAVNLLGLLPGTEITAISSLYETEPVADVGNPGPGWFLNGVVRLQSEVKPYSLREVCLEVERALGRDQENRRGPRTVDLDILSYGSQVLSEPELVIPHPRLHLRRFVLAPLVELDPDWHHPLLDRTARELLESLTDPSEVRRIEPPPPHSRFGSRLTYNSRSNNG